jgi:opacity protein-like surface antigen
MKKFLAVLAVLAVVSAAGSAFAQPVDLRVVGVVPGTGVWATFQGTLGQIDVQTGYYQLKINDGATINGFCVDPSLSNGNTNTPYNLIAIPGENYERAAWILSQAQANVFGYDPLDAQIAVWEVVTDRSPGDIYSGVFRPRRWGRPSIMIPEK